MTQSLPRPGSSVVADFMTDCDRRLRPPLDTWAAGLCRDLESAGRQEWTRSRVRSASAAMNLAALLIAHSGDLRAAERLCHTQLAWLRQLASTSADVSVLGHALQPWINLGRLRVLAGQPDASLPHFRLIEDLRARRPVRLGPCHIESGMWEPLLIAEPDLPDVLWNVFVLDQLKARLRSGDPAHTLAAATTLRGVAPAGTHRFIAEGEIIAFLRSGRAEEALDKAARFVPPTTSDEIAFLLHQIAAATAAGRSEDARRLAIGLTAFVTQSAVPSAEPATFLRRLKHLAVLLETLDAPRFALAVHLRGMDTCREQTDEPLCLAFTEGALRVAPDHRYASRWRSTRERLLAGSLYAEVRARRRPDGTREHPALRDLIAAVEAAATRVGVPAAATGCCDR